MNNLYLYRSAVGLTCAQIGHLICVRSTTYMLIEKRNEKIDPIVAIMLAKAYGIAPEQMTCLVSEIKAETMSKLDALAKMAPEDKIKTMTLNLSDGRFERPTFKKVNIVINELQKQLEKKNSPCG